MSTNKTTTLIFRGKGTIDARRQIKTKYWNKSTRTITWQVQCHTKYILQINKTFTEKWIINRVIHVKPFKV